MRSTLRGAAAALLLLAGTAHGEPLSPDAALTRAAKRNPTLRAAVHDLAASRHAYDAEDHARDPVLFLGVTGQYAESFSGSSRGVTRNDSKTISGEGGVRYTTPIGTALELGTTNGVTWRTTNIDVSTTESVTIGPNYTAEIYATGRQPILRGGGTDSVLAPVRQAEQDKTRAEQQRDGIMNIMLVSVRERTREIGVRMAVGARRRDVLMQFLVKAIVVSIFGGPLGIAFGYLVAMMVARLGGWATVVPLYAVFLSLGVSIAIGIVFGVGPARRASRLDPVEALRQE
jgi:hypothetical protein